MKLSTITVVLLIVLFTPWVFAGTGFKFPAEDPTKSANEQMHLFNIPKEVLTQMSTEELGEVCIAWPYVDLSLISFTTELQKVNYVLENFNGLKELFSRPDSGTVLLELYEAIDMNTMMPKTVNEKTDKQLDEQLRQEFIETLLAYPVIFSKLLDSEKEQLKETSILKYKYAQQNMKSLGPTPLINTSKILLLFVNEQNPPKELDLTKPEGINWLLNSISN
jgi:hypothetical protein